MLRAYDTGGDLSQNDNGCSRVNMRSKSNTFRCSVGVSADPGPAESWDVQSCSLLNGVSKRGVSGTHSDGALWCRAWFQIGCQRL